MRRLITLRIIKQQIDHIVLHIKIHLEVVQTLSVWLFDHTI
jgi:hypothetical protein